MSNQARALTTPEALPAQPQPAPGSAHARVGASQASLDRPDRSPHEGLAKEWRASIEEDPATFWARWSHLSHPNASPTGFQSAHWLRDWYATLGSQPHVEPVLVRVYDRVTQQDKLLLPLIRLRQSGLRILAPADLDVTDVNCPLMQSGLQFDTAQSRAMWQVLRRTLAQAGDVLRISKMPSAAQGQSNPLSLALTCRPSPSVGYAFHVPGEWEQWHRSLKRQARRESDRHWRVFQAYPRARLERVTEADRAVDVFQQLDAMQTARLGGRCKYVLDQPAYRDFYRLRLLNGLRDGSVVLTAMSSGDETIAAAYGIRHRNTLTLLRVAFGGEQWKACAPGRLIMERTAQLMWEEGCRTFDLSIGSYAHKNTFGCTEYGLLELCTPLTWRGVPAALAWHAKHVFAPYKAA